jgi:flagellin-like hook-associated protein FlgL
MTITLTSSMRANLVSLQASSSLLGKTQARLSTGLKVNSAIDSPANYFAARGHSQRAGLLAGLKDNISEAIQTVKAADGGVQGILSTIESLRGVIAQARSALNDTVNSGTTLAGLATQYNSLLTQLDNLASDSSYKGINFLSGTSQTLTVNFNENATTKLTMSGFDASAAGLGISGMAGGGYTKTVVGTPSYDGAAYSSPPAAILALNSTATWYWDGDGGPSGYWSMSSGFDPIYYPDGTLRVGPPPSVTSYYVFAPGGGSTSPSLTATDLSTASNLNSMESKLNAAIATLQTKSSELAANLNILTTRQGFIGDLINVLNDGATRLTEADSNEEAANLLMLQTSQQLGTTALSLSAQAAQAVLRLF